MSKPAFIKQQGTLVARSLVLCAGAAAAVLLVLPAAGSAATFEDVEVTTTGPGFFASAPLCPFGHYEHAIQLVNTGVPFRPPQPFEPGQFPTLQALLNAPTVIATGTTSFVCADGTGTFEFSWHAHGMQPFSEFSSGIEGRFHVTGGTGSYAGLEGGGSLQTLFGSCCGVGFSITFDGRFSLP